MYFAAIGRRGFFRCGATGTAIIAQVALFPTIASGENDGAPVQESTSEESVIVGTAPGEGAAPVEVVGPAAAPASSRTGSDPQISALEIQTLALVNGARASRGIRALEWDQTMAGAARAHAADMARRGIVSHTGSDGASPNERLRRAGVQFRFGSENIWTYWGKVPADGPSTMHAAMMSEPHAPGLWNHIGNILYTGYRRVGIGIVTGANGVQYLSEKFAD